MKKNKKKIIISLSLLLLVILILLGFTYAYFSQKIIGNQSDESIRAKGKKLEVTYADGDAYFRPTSTDSDTTIEGDLVEDIIPGSTFTKEFSVENTGDYTATYSIKIDNVENTYSRRTDWQYKLIKVAADGSEKTVATGSVPKTFNYIVDSVTIDANVVDNYKLKIMYIYYESADQSVDMGEKLSFRVNISDALGEGTIFLGASSDTLLKSIGENNVITNTITSPGDETSATTENVFAVTEDDFGESYYFRGAVNNNYVNFAGMCWRIVRVQGNGSVKLLLEDFNAECNSDTYTGDFNVGMGNYGYQQITRSDGTKYIKADYLNPVSAVNNAMINIFKKFETTLASKINSSVTSSSDRSAVVSALSTKLDSGNWCDNNKAYSKDKLNTSKIEPLSENEINDNYLTGTTFYFDTLVRLKKDSSDVDSVPSLQCNGRVMDTYLDSTPIFASTLTADEYAFAGSRLYVNNSTYYIINDYIRTQKPKIYTLSKGNFTGNDQILYFYTDPTGVARVTTTNSSSNFVARPSIVLKSDVLVTAESGNGTKDAPYIVE